MGNFAIAQKVIPVKLEIEKEIPGETFPNTGLKLEFWIEEQNKFISLDTAQTKMLLFEDDSGTDILKAHQKAISEYEKQQKENGYINFTIIKNFTPGNEVANWQGKSVTIVKNGSSSSDEAATNE